MPFNLSITERKKGKTVILNWEHTPASSASSSGPVMFVVEGRWSLKTSLSASASQQQADASMTRWGYLTQTVNTKWVILRSINRGRWYKFRVAAGGSLGYSPPTELFILSSPPQPPSAPQNLSVVRLVSRVASASSDPAKVDVEL